MKKYLLLLTSYLLVSCGPLAVLSASEVALKVEMGMTVDEFERLTDRRAQVFERTMHGISFSVDDFNTVGQASGYKLFHFNSEGRLYRIETRRLQPVYQSAPASSPVPASTPAPARRSIWD